MKTKNKHCMKAALSIVAFALLFLAAMPIDAHAAGTVTDPYGHFVCSDDYPCGGTGRTTGDMCAPDATNYRYSYTAGCQKYWGACGAFTCCQGKYAESVVHECSIDQALSQQLPACSTELGKSAYCVDACTASGQSVTPCRYGFNHACYTVPPGQAGGCQSGQVCNANAQCECTPGTSSGEPRGSHFNAPCCAGGCELNGKCYSSGGVPASAPCSFCNGAAGAFSVNPGNCLINGTCYADGAQIGNACQVCGASTSQTIAANAPSGTACGTSTQAGCAPCTRTCDGAGTCLQCTPSTCAVAANQLLLSCPATTSVNDTSVVVKLFVNGVQSCSQGASLSWKRDGVQAGSQSLGACNGQSVYNFSAQTQLNGTYVFTASSAGAQTASCTSIRMVGRPSIRVPDLPPALGLAVGLLIALFYLRRKR